MTVHNHGPAEGRGLDCPETILEGRLTGICLVSEDQGTGFIEIPVEKIIDGEVVVVDTKSLPILPKKE